LATDSDNYLAVSPRVHLEAVREAKGEAAAQLIDHLKKSEMAKKLNACSRTRAGSPSHCGSGCSRRRTLPIAQHSFAAGIPVR